MTDTAQFRDLLEGRRAYLNTRLHTIEDTLDEPATPDIEDRASEREGDEVMERLGSSGLVEIRMIDAALSRIENGSYGVCVNCGAAISEKRLIAVPTATLCRRCMNG